MPREFNFIHAGNPASDRALFFGPLDETDTFATFDETWDMADIAVKAGKFPSRGQARKNGWDGPVPLGFSTHYIGQNAKRVGIFILNRIPE